jgi:gliding motility associated protien GldN
MKKQFLRGLFFIVLIAGFASTAEAQKRSSTKRNTTRKTTKTKTKAKIQAAKPTADTTAMVAAPVEPAKDSLPIKTVKKSLRPDEAVETTALRDRVPLPYEHLRADDAVYRHKIWREIDIREKINQPFRYAADENNGNQRFISILLQAIQDSASGITVFNAIDDRFTTPMTLGEVSQVVGGDSVPVPQYDSLGNLTGTTYKRNEINLDSFYKFRIKEEVIFDKESSRLFWRILGIAPLKNVITSQGLNLGETELFWAYYPDLRPVLARYEVYNGKNYGARMSWEELFESRMFHGRIIKSTIDNPNDLSIKNYKGFEDNGVLQLLEGEHIKEKIFNYEQDLWSY